MKLYVVSFKLPETFQSTTDISEALKYDYRNVADRHCEDIPKYKVTVSRDGEPRRHGSNFRVESSGNKFVIAFDTV